MCWGYGSSGQSQCPGTVPGFWDSLKSPGLSQAFGFLRLKNIHHGVGTQGIWDSPNVQWLSKLLEQSQRPGTVPGFWVSEIEKYTPWCWDSGSLGQSQRPSFWDSPKVLGPSHAFGSLKLRNNPHGVGTLKSLGQSQPPGTVPGIWDCPKVLGLSQAFGSLRLRNNSHGVKTLGLWDSPNV